MATGGLAPTGSSSAAAWGEDEFAELGDGASGLVCHS
jgi:hypothetical protein